MYELKIEYDEIKGEKDIENVFFVLKELDIQLARLEHRRHYNNFAKKLELYHKKVNEEIEKIEEQNLPETLYNKQVLLIFDYYKIFDRITPQDAINIAEEELVLIETYLKIIKKIWLDYQNYIKNKFN